jgi:hypothetical protein
MRHKTLLARAAAVTMTMATAVAGVAVVTTAPAQAALTETDFAFKTWAFGTYASTGPVGLTSAPTAFSHISCTRFAGKKDNEGVLAANVPQNTPGLSVGAVTSHSETFKSGSTVGDLSTNKVAAVALGPSNGPHIVIKGLEGNAKVWHTKDDKFHATSAFKLADITAQTGTPLDDVLNQAGIQFGDLATLITKQVNDTLTIPGLGSIKLGSTVNRTSRLGAVANSTALRVTLYGQDGVKSADDIDVVVGRIRSQINKDVPAGVMSGEAYAVNASVLGGLVGVGKLPRQPLPCQGTRGKVVTESIAGLDLLNLGQLQVGAATASVYGVQNDNGSATAWTQGRLANLKLGSGATSLEIKAVVGRANVHKSKSGKLARTTTGTSVGQIIAAGTTYEIPKPGEVLEIPGIATIRFGVKEFPNKRSIMVTALRITLVPAAQQDTGLVTINLGVARAGIKKF